MYTREEDYSNHYISIDGTPVLWTREWDNVEQAVASSISVIYPLKMGQRVAVDPDFTGTVTAKSQKGYAASWFGISLLYPD